MYNTSTLGYKLITGKLKEKRKHSEQLNKYLAGLIDTDGCVALFFYKTRTTNKQRVKLVVSLTQAASNDPDFETIRALKDFYNLGSIHFGVSSVETESSTCTWTLRDKEAKMLFNRIGKHLRLKGTHYDNLIWISEQHKNIDDFSSDIMEELKVFSKCSRDKTKWLKMPKHLSWAYVAGVIAGDGCLKCHKRVGRNYHTMVVKITQSNETLLNLFKRDFKGSIFNIRSWYDWERSLGIKDSSFAVMFLKKIRMYLIHPRKYEICNEMLDIHEQHRQQRLNKRGPKG